jgi:hypothetical protein
LLLTWRMLPALVLRLLARALTALLLAHTLIGVLGLLALITLVLVRLAFGHSSFSFVEPSNAEITPEPAERCCSGVVITGRLQGAIVTVQQIALQRKSAWIAQLSRTPPCCRCRHRTVRKRNSDREIPAAGVSASPTCEHGSTIRGLWIISPSN